MPALGFLFQHVFTLYESGRLTEAEQLLRSVRSKLEEARDSGDDSCARAVAGVDLLKEMNDDPLVSHVIELVCEKRKILQCQDQAMADAKAKGWALSELPVSEDETATVEDAEAAAEIERLSLEGAKTDDVHIWEWQDKSTGSVSCMADGFVEGDLIAIVAALSEIDLFTLWVRKLLGFGLELGSQFGIASRSDRAGKMVWNMPWPLAWREAIVECFLCDMLSLLTPDNDFKKQIMIVVRSIDTSPVLDSRSFRSLSFLRDIRGIPIPKDLVPPVVPVSESKTWTSWGSNMLKTAGSGLKLGAVGVAKMTGISKSEPVIPGESGRGPNVRAFMTCGNVITPLSPTSCQFRIQMTLDIQLPVPTAFIIRSLREVIRNAFRLLRSIAIDCQNRKENPILERMSLHKPIYDRLRRRLEYVFSENTDLLKSGESDDLEADGIILDDSSIRKTNEDILERVSMLLNK